MAINLASKYAKTIDQVYTRSSYVAGVAKAKYDFTGVKGVTVISPLTQDLVDYARSGANRYGTPNEMQDEKQDLILTQDKGFALTIDKGNATEQNGTKEAGSRLKQQVEEKVTPLQDRYVLAQFVRNAGTVVGAAAPTAATMYSMLVAAQSALDNKEVPNDGRYAYIGATNVAFLVESGKIIYSPNIAGKAFAKGEVGEVAGFKIVKVPDSYLPTGCHLLAFHNMAVCNPHKIHDTKLHTDPPGISGHLLEGRFIYDAYVMGKKSGGVYACVLTASKQAAPAIAVASGTATITSAGATAIKVTTDGSDPRYSGTAVTIQTGGTVAGVGSTYNIKAVAYGTFTSDVTTKTA